MDQVKVFPIRGRPHERAHTGIFDHVVQGTLHHSRERANALSLCLSISLSLSLSHSPTHTHTHRHIGRYRHKYTLCSLISDHNNETENKVTNQLHRGWPTMASASVPLAKLLHSCCANFLKPAASATAAF